MTQKRIVLLGATGLGKKDVAERFCRWCKDNLDQTMRVIDFEGEYLTARQKGGDALPHFLTRRPAEQYEKWCQAWKHLEYRWKTS